MVLHPLELQWGRAGQGRARQGQFLNEDKGCVSSIYDSFSRAAAAVSHASTSHLEWKGYSMHTALTIALHTAVCLLMI